jgi:hypothetical protein
MIDGRRQLLAVTVFSPDQFQMLRFIRAVIVRNGVGTNHCLELAPCDLKRRGTDETLPSNREFLWPALWTTRPHPLVNIAECAHKAEDRRLLWHNPNAADAMYGASALQSEP